MEIQSLQREVQNLGLEKEDNMVRMQQELGEVATANDRLRQVNSSLSANNWPSLSGNGSRFSISGYNVPLPQQGTFNGKGCWESFSKGFQRSAEKCGWDDDEKV